MDVAGFEQLLTRRGQRLLELAMSSYGEIDPLALNERLRTLDGGYPADQVATALTQASLRRSAVSKFEADADQMYFTDAGLEQATHPVVAAHRAARAGALASGTVLDLGCGIGSDLAALSRAGFEVHGVDSDALTAAVARANLAALGLRGSVQHAQAADVEWSGHTVVFADPARRRGTGRLFDPRAFSPSWEFVLALLCEGQTDRRAGPALVVVKLGPGLDHDLVPPDVEAEWVSLDGDLKEVALWSRRPAATTPARRRATVLARSGDTASCSDLAAPAEPPEVASVGTYLYEPDPAVIRAHLVSSVAADLGGWLLDPHIAYISSHRAVRTPFARGFRVLETLPFKEKALRAALRSRRIGALTVKKRGVAVRPEDLRRRLSLRGPEQATLILSRTPGSAVALLVEPLDSSRH